MAERIPLNSLQKAIYSRLVGYADIATATGKTGAESVFDYVPRPEPFPYIAVGETEGASEDHKDYATSAGAKIVTVSLYVASEAPGYLETNNILNAIAGALTQELTLTDNFEVGDHRIDRWEAHKEQAPAGEIVHRGLLKYRFLIWDSA